MKIPGAGKIIFKRKSHRLFSHRIPSGERFYTDSKSNVRFTTCLPFGKQANFSLRAAGF
jgi:hypothetical protein